MSDADRPDLDPGLAELAAAHGITTSYVGNDDVVRHPPVATIRAALAAMDVACETETDVVASLAAVRADRWRRPVSPTSVIRSAGPRTIRAVRRADRPLAIRIELEDGGRVELDGGVPTGRSEFVDGERFEEVTVTIAETVPVGEHRLRVDDGDRVGEAVLLIVPDRCPLPSHDRLWGWQVQLYAMRSSRSWGIGDLADLAELARVAGREHGADFILLNPLHADAAVLPRANSPYSPSSRRAFDPIYLRPEECDGWDIAVGGPNAARLAELSESMAQQNTLARIDRDTVHAAKDEALRILASQPLPEDRGRALAAFRRRAGVEQIALGLALTERHGRDVGRWPAELARADGPGVAAARVELADEIDRHVWLQWQLDEQLERAQAAARDAGMEIGLITDLAVGVDGSGVDVWSLADDLATTMSVGAPPDALAQLGQDWGLPPLRPDRLAEHGYRAFRDIIAANVRRAGGLRIDHVLGLWRLFWIPRGRPASEGTYIRYDADAMLGVLAFEAERAGAVVVGEDLGTVEEGVRPAMAERGVLGSAVFWFERPPESAADGDRPARTDEYRRIAMTSVTTHDLATAAGWFADEPTRIRGALGQLATDVATERRAQAAGRARLLDLLESEGVLATADRDDVDAFVRAVHAFVGRTPSMLVAASLADAVGDLRQPNLPGTLDEYPNWRLPIAQPDPDGDDAGTAGLLPPSTPVLLDELLRDSRVEALAGVLTAARRSQSAPD